MSTELSDVARLALEVREAERELKDTLAARNDAILVAHQAGHVLREIGERAGMLVGSIQRIVLAELLDREQPEND